MAINNIKDVRFRFVTIAISYSGAKFTDYWTVRPFYGEIIDKYKNKYSIKIRKVLMFKLIDEYE